MKKLYWVSILTFIFLASAGFQTRTAVAETGKVVIGADEETKEEAKSADEIKKSDDKKNELEKKPEEIKPAGVKTDESKAAVENKTAAGNENKEIKKEEQDKKNDGIQNGSETKTADAAPKEEVKKPETDKKTEPPVITVAPPAGVVAKYSGAPSASAELSWQEVEGAAYYLVYRCEKEEFAADPGYKNYTFQVSGKASLTDSEISEDKTYYYYIVTAVRDKADAKNKIYSKPSQAIKIETADRTPPEMPQGFMADVKDEKIVLKWNKNSEPDAAGYIVKKGFSRDGLSVLKKIDGAASCEYSDGDIEDGKEYFYAVLAFDKKGNESKPSAPTSVKPENKAPIAAPDGIRIETAENGKIQIAWNETKRAGFKNYAVLRGDTNDAGKLQPAGESAAASFRDEGLENGKTYYYAVIAVNKYGVRGGPSNVLKVTVKDTIAPAAPQNLMASPAAGKVTLSWERSKENDVKFYTVFRSENKESGFEKIKDASELTENGFADKSVRPRTEYYYKVTAADGSSNESERSAAIMVKTPSAVSISFGRTGSSYYGFSFNMENHSVEYSESGDGKSWKWWSVIQSNMPLPEEFAASSKIAFAKDAKKIAAFIYDSEKTFIKIAVSGDNGKSWKWWSDYSSSLPLPDEFNDNTIVSFSIKGDLVTCLCFDPAKKWLTVASTTNGKAWKWWKKAGENLGDLPNSSEMSVYSAAAAGDEYEVYSYNLKDLTLYKGLINKAAPKFSTWVEVCAKFPKPSNIEK